MKGALYRRPPAEAKRPGSSFAIAAAIAAALAIPSAGCNDVRQRECQRFAAATAPLDLEPPTGAGIDGVLRQLDAARFEDQALAVYVKNTRATLVVLSNVLRLEATGSAPDGTKDAIKQHLKAARTDRADVARYCAP